jgi:hypothetical protein
LEKLLHDLNVAAETSKKQLEGRAFFLEQNLLAATDEMKRVHQAASQMESEKQALLEIQEKNLHRSSFSRPNIWINRNNWELKRSKSSRK